MPRKKKTTKTEPKTRPLASSKRKSRKRSKADEKGRLEDLAWSHLGRMNFGMAWNYACQANDIDAA